MFNMLFYMLCWFWFMCLVVVFWPTCRSISNSFSDIILSPHWHIPYHILHAVYKFLYFKRNKELNFLVFQLIANRNWLLVNLWNFLMKYFDLASFFHNKVISCLKWVEIFLAGWRSTLILFLLYVLGIWEDQWVVTFVSYLDILVT